MTPPYPLPANLVLPFSEYLHRRERADTTASTYCLAVRECLLSLSVDLDRDVQLEDLTLRRLQDWADCLPGAPSTRQVKVQSLRNFIKFLSGKLELPVKDVSAYLEAPPVPVHPPKFLSVEECEKLMVAPRRQERPGMWQVLAVRDEAILHVLWGGGLRAAELCGLDLDRVKLDVPQRGDVSLHVFGKGKRWRWVVCPGRVRQALGRYLAVRAQFLCPRQTETALFLSFAHHRLSDRALYEVVRQHGAAADLGHVHPHLLRHCCATHLLWGGAEICAVQTVLGHANIAMTRRYAAVDLVHQRERGTAHHPLMQSREAGPGASPLLLVPEPLVVVPQGDPRLAVAQVLAQQLLLQQGAAVN